MVGGGGEIEPASAVFGPRLAGERRVKGDVELAGVLDGVGGKVEGHTMKAMVSRERGVGFPRAHVVEGELGLGIKSCQRLGGKVMWAAEKMAMTWFLAVRIDRSAGLER